MNQTLESLTRLIRAHRRHHQSDYIAAVDLRDNRALVEPEKSFLVNFTPQTPLHGLAFIAQRMSASPCVCLLATDNENQEEVIIRARREKAVVGAHSGFWYADVLTIQQMLRWIFPPFSPFDSGNSEVPLIGYSALVPSQNIEPELARVYQLFAQDIERLVRLQQTTNPLRRPQQAGRISESLAVLANMARK